MSGKLLNHRGKHIKKRPLPRAPAKDSRKRRGKAIDYSNVVDAREKSDRKKQEIAYFDEDEGLFEGHKEKLEDFHPRFLRRDDVVALAPPLLAFGRVRA